MAAPPEAPALGSGDPSDPSDPSEPCRWSGQRKISTRASCLRKDPIQALGCKKTKNALLLSFFIHLSGAGKLFCFLALSSTCPGTDVWSEEVGSTSSQIFT